MALATLSTAWCSFESAAWTRKSNRLMNEFNALERRAGLLTMQGMQQATIHTGMFMQALAAHQAGNDKLVNFYIERFPPELRKAYDAWLAEKPFENPNADPHPFVPNVYEMRGSREAADASAKAANSQQEAGSAGSISGQYLANTVLFATVLFFANASAKFEQRRGACRRIRFCCSGFPVCRCADSDAPAVKACARPHRCKTDVRLPLNLTWLR